MKELIRTSALKYERYKDHYEATLNPVAFFIGSYQEA